MNLIRSLYVGASISAVFWVTPLVAQSVIIGGNDVIERPHVDGADGILFTDLNAPISVGGTIDSWSIWAKQSGGSIQMLIYRDLGSDWQFVGSSGVETVPAVGLNVFSLSSPFTVLSGDLISWWYPNNTTPSVAFNEPGALVGTMNNHDWPGEPITDLTAFFGTFPDLSTLGSTEFQNTVWDNNPRTYSIAVHGTAIPEPASVGLLAVGLALLFLRKRARC